MTFDELTKILLSDKPSEQIKAHEQEIFALIPELETCKGFDQHNHWHIYDVYEHILHVVDEVPNNILLRLSALFHDLGKPSSFTLDENGVGHAYGHWQESCRIFDEFATINNIPLPLKKRVDTLVYYHDLHLEKLDDESLLKIGIDNIKPLFQLKRADLLAQNPKYHYLLESYKEQENEVLSRIIELNQKELERILLSDNVKESINNNVDRLLEIIPEIRHIVGFPHNHPHHHLDVWNHTLLALSLSDKDLITRLTLLLHDIGKPFSYQDAEVRHFHNHAEVSANISKGILERLGYPKKMVEEIVYLIRYHDTEITRDDIQEKLELTLKRLHIQECDSKAHNPDYQAKRLEYIDKIKKLVNQHNVDK